MSATNDSTEINFEGPDCQVPYTFVGAGIELPKPNYNLRFYNADQEEIATLDFNGPGLAFEGIADEAAIVFVNWIAECFAGRLKDERNKVRQECIKICEETEDDGCEYDVQQQCANKIMEGIEK